MKNKFIFQVMISGAGGKRDRKTPIPGPAKLVLPPDLPSVSVQFSSVAQSCPTLCDPMNRSTPGLPVHHQLPEFTQTQLPTSQ